MPAGRVLAALLSPSGMHGGAPSDVRGRARPTCRRSPAMLARAFFDDPVAIWACRHDRLRPAMLERFHDARLRQLVGERRGLDRAGIGERRAVGAARALAHDACARTSRCTRSLLHPRLISRMPRGRDAGCSASSARTRATPPHWYLAVLGTDPPAQGQGLGSAVLAPVLEQCDARRRRRLPRVLEGAQHRLLRAPRLPRHARAAAPARPDDVGDVARPAPVGAAQPRRGSLWAAMRICSLLPSATEIVAALGLADSLVGVSEECDWPPEIRGLPVVSASRVDTRALAGARSTARCATP